VPHSSPLAIATTVTGSTVPPASRSTVSPDCAPFSARASGAVQANKGSAHFILPFNQKESPDLGGRGQGYFIHRTTRGLGGSGTPTGLGQRLRRHTVPPVRIIFIPCQAPGADGFSILRTWYQIDTHPRRGKGGVSFERVIGPNATAGVLGLGAVYRATRHRIPRLGRVTKRGSAVFQERQ
jgi:hypothetical protein